MSGLWYVAYGSNKDPALLRRHLPGAAPDHRPLVIDHPLWFGGRSRRWAGGVAFLGLRPVPGTRTPCRAYRIERDALARIFASENLVAHPGSGVFPDLGGLEPGRHVRGDLRLSRDGTLGKYDAVLRLADLDGLPAYTITTARHLKPRPPDPAYAAVVGATALEAAD